MASGTFCVPVAPGDCFPMTCRRGNWSTTTFGLGAGTVPGRKFMMPCSPGYVVPWAAGPVPPELAEGAAIIDSQSVKTTEKGGLEATTQARM